MKNKLLIIFIIFSIVTIVSGEGNITLNSPVTGYNTTDTTPSFNFTVTGNESSYSCELFIDNVGYGTSRVEDDAEDSHTCSGSFPASYPCSNAVDEDWNTGAKTVCSPLQAVITYSYVYENHNIPSATHSINWVFKVGGPYGMSETYVYYWNYSSPAWTSIFSAGSVGTHTKNIPSDGSNSVLKIKTTIRCQGALWSSGQYYEGKAIWINVTNNSAYILTANASLSDGTYNWYINCTAGGVTNQSATRSITLERGPDFISPTPSNGWNSSGNNSFSVAVQAKTSITYDSCKFEWNSTTNTTMNEINSTHFNYTKTETTSGNYSYRVICNDSSDGDWVDSETRNLIIYNPPVDSTPCDIYGCTPQSVAFSWSTSYVSLACYSNEPCSLRYDIINRGYDSMLNPFTSTGGTTHTVQVPVEVNREYLWYITGIDNAGNNHSSSEATSSCSVDDRTGSGGGGGGEKEVEKKYFTVNPRYVGEGYDKPEPAELTQGESKLYVVKNTGKTTLDISLMVKGENVVLPAGIWMDTGEFILISSPSFFRLERGEEINLQVTADLPESVDKTKKYYVDILLITTGHEEKIEVMVQYSRVREDGWFDMPAFYGLVWRDVAGLLISIGLVLFLAFKV